MLSLAFFILFAVDLFLLLSKKNISGQQLEDKNTLRPPNVVLRVILDEITYPPGVSIRTKKVPKIIIEADAAIELKSIYFEKIDAIEGTSRVKRFIVNKKTFRKILVDRDFPEIEHNVFYLIQAVDIDGRIEKGQPTEVIFSG